MMKNCKYLLILVSGIPLTCSADVVEEKSKSYDAVVENVATALVSGKSNREELAETLRALTLQMQELQKQIDQLKSPAESEKLSQMISELSKQLKEIQNRQNEASQGVLDAKRRVSNIEGTLQEIPSTIDALSCQTERYCQEIDYVTQVQENSLVLSNTENRFYVFGNYLYWKIEEAGTEFAVEANAAPLLAPGTLVNGDEQDLNFNWSSGFRVGGGYEFPCGGWGVAANYTQLKTKGSETDNTLTSSTRAIFPLLIYQVAEIPSVGFASASWGIDFKNVDLELGRNFCVGRCFKVRPVVGWKWAWINQNITVDYSGGSVLGGSTYQINTINDFSGSGLKMGLGSTWDFWSDFGLFATASGALLRGNFDVSQTQLLAGSMQLSIDNNVSRFVPEVQFQLGIHWDIGLFTFSAAYENQYWWRQNQLARFTQQLNPNYVKTAEDLSVHGLTVEGMLRF